MPWVEPKPDDVSAGPPSPVGDVRAGGDWLRWIGWSTVVFCVDAVLATGIGFIWFVAHVPRDALALDRNADGIVALTGGASRVADALELLAAKRGQRLLISGLNRSTTVAEIARLNPEFARDVRC